MSVLRAKRKDESLLDLPSTAWAMNERAAAAKIADLRTQHEAALASVAEIAARVAAGNPDARKQLADAREHAAELADAIDAAVSVADAARREFETARKREDVLAAAEREKQTAASAIRVNAAAVAVERLASELQRAGVTYMQEATEYGGLTGGGRDFAAPEHHTKLRIRLRNVLIATLQVAEIPGYKERHVRGLLKPAPVATFLD